LGARLLLVAALGCTILVLAGCQSAQQTTTTNGAVLYAQNCAGCHGTNGDQGVAPPLNDPLFLQLESDQDLYQVIDAGRTAYLMPAFGQDQRGTLSAEQINANIAWMRSQWQPGAAAATATVPAAASATQTVSTFGTPAAAGTATAVTASATATATAAPPTTPSGVSLASAPPGNAGRGQALFAAACASCHGPGGAGGSGGAINDPSYLALTSNAELRRIIVTGLPDRKMPAYNQLSVAPLTNQDVSDLVAYLAGMRPPASATPSP
jgi:cytochrome c oxidase cbb3-type subunit 3